MTNVKAPKGVQMKEYDCRKNTNYVKHGLDANVNTLIFKA